MAKHKPNGVWLSGTYDIKNPHKYEGDIKDCIFRSSYELTAFKICDTNPSILRWSAEEVIIPYFNPIKGRMSKYMMDLKVVTINADTGLEQTTLIEIKPEAQTKPPRKGRKSQDSYLRECATYAVNKAKWDTTEVYCQQKGWNFVKWTEQHLVAGKAHDREVKEKMKEHRKEKKKVKSTKAARSKKVKALGRTLASQMRTKIKSS